MAMYKRSTNILILVFSAWLSMINVSYSSSFPAFAPEELIQQDINVGGGGDSDSDGDGNMAVYDPYENYNRSMYTVNKKIDKYLIKPPAQLYSVIVPVPAKQMISNFFSNIFDITVLFNDVLQLEGANTADTLSRLLINSSFGIFGLIDVAKDMGFTKRNNDFGITLGKWGMEHSNYFVIPVFGPSTVRDAVGKGLGYASTYAYYNLPPDYEFTVLGLYILDLRASLLTTEKIIDTVSDDEYIFVRNAYFQYRDALIRGEKPDEKHEAYEEKLLDNILGASNDSSKKNEDTNDTKDSEDDGLKDLEDLGGLDDLKDLDSLN